MDGPLKNCYFEKGTNPKFRIFERLMVFLVVEWIVVRAFVGMSTDLLYCFRDELNRVIVS